MFTQLNDQTVLFLTIQYIINHLFSQFKYQTILFNPLIGPYQVQPLQVRVYLGAMTMKGYSSFSKAPPLLVPHHQIVHCQIQDTHWGAPIPLQRAVSVFYSPNRLGKVMSMFDTKYCFEQLFSKMKHNTNVISLGILKLNCFFLPCKFINSRLSEMYYLLSWVSPKCWKLAITLFLLNRNIYFIRDFTIKQ